MITGKSQKYHARVAPSADGFQIHIGGDHAKGIDHKMLESCVNELLACAETHDCFNPKVGFSMKCVETIVNHNRQCGCASQAFGFSASAGKP